MPYGARRQGGEIVEQLSTADLSLIDGGAGGIDGVDLENMLGQIEANPRDSRKLG
jgi:hypothetical protein